MARVEDFDVQNPRDATIDSHQLRGYQGASLVLRSVVAAPSGEEVEGTVSVSCG